MNPRLLLCVLAISACDRRDYQFCALLPPSREYKLQVLDREAEGHMSFEWGGGPVHELSVSTPRGRWRWGVTCDETDEDGLQAPCVSSPVTFPLADAQPALVSGQTYEVHSVMWCAVGGDETEQRDQRESFVAP
jgi:hypothetical protein